MRNKTKLLGILNLTSDSFSDGGKFINFDNAKAHVDRMIDDGCNYIDIGAESTKPGYSDVSDEVQINRILPIIDYIQSLDKKIRQKKVKKVIIRNKNLRIKIPNNFEKILENKVIDKESIEINRN